SSCTVTGWNHVGGLVGDYLEGNLSSSYATGRVTGHDAATDTGDIGGLVGRGGAHIVDCFATGVVQGTNSMDGIGGLVGTVYGNPGGTISRCYSTGRVVSGATHVGGLIGGKSASTRVELCAWDVEASGRDQSAGGVGLTTRQMQDRATYGD